jgi:hypothetical protein
MHSNALLGIANNEQLLKNFSAAFYKNKLYKQSDIKGFIHTVRYKLSFASQMEVQQLIPGLCGW